MPLLAAYSFDEASGDVLDYSGNSRDFALNANLARTVTGHTGNGVTKTGTGMPVVAAPSFVGTGAWTVMFWRQGLGDTVWWVRLYNTAADTGSGILLLGGTLRVRIRKASNTEATVAPPGDGGWHHYAATYDGTVGRLYIDAVLVATTATVTAPTAAVDRIDMLEHTQPDTFTDDLRFHDTALSQAEIAALMDTPVTDSAETGSGTATLAATAGVAVSGMSHRSGTVTLAASASAAASGRKTAAGSALLAAIGAIASAGAKTVAAVKTLTAAAVMAVSGSSARAGSVALSASSALAVGPAADEHDITLTASLAAQPAAPVTVGSRRWTATLGEQP